jgi:hypothetical protein
MLVHVENSISVGVWKKGNISQALHCCDTLRDANVIT